MSIGRGMHKDDAVHIYNGILVTKKYEIMLFTVKNDGPRNYHTKWSQTEKDKYNMTLLLCGM